MMRRSLLACCLVFLGLFAAYVHALNPAFRADDSPETQASCVTLGIQHPPGYPLHTLVGRIFSLLPLGSPAWRLNLLAAFFGALTCALLGATIPLMAAKSGHPGPPLPGALAGILLGLSPTFWSQSLAAKGGIYTLHTFFLAAFFLGLCLWHADMEGIRDKPQSSKWRMFRSKYFVFAAFVFFLGFGNHWETQALFGPAVLAWLWFSWKEIQVDPKMPAGKGLGKPIFRAAGLGLAALSVYLYLPIRASQDPVMNWGEPSNMKQFLWVLLRQEYIDLEVGFLKSLRQALLAGGSWAEVGANWAYVQRQVLRVLDHLVGLKADLTIPGFAVAAWGAWQLWKNKGKAALGFLVTLVAAFIFIVAFYFHLKTEMIWILDVFLLPAYFAVAVLAGVGIHAGLKWVERAGGPRPYPGLWILAPALFIGMAWAHGGTVSQKNHYWAWDFGKNFLMSCKKNAIVFAEGDFNTMPIYYLQKVKGERQDLTHITTIFASTDWGLDQLKRRHPELGITARTRPVTNQRVGDGAQLADFMGELVTKYNGKRPIHASLFRQVQSENLAWAEPHFSPSGLTAELNAMETVQQQVRREGLAKAMVIRQVQDQSRYEPSPEFALSNYGTLYMELGAWLLKRGQGAAALEQYAKAVQCTTKPNLAEAWTHWGIALASQGRQPEAVEKFLEAVKVKPLFEAYANLAGASNQLKRFVEAEGYARKAVELSPQNGQSWNNLAISLYYQGKRDEAIRSLERASSFAPGDPGIQANLQALRAGK